MLAPFGYVFVGTVLGLMSSLLSGAAFGGAKQPSPVKQESKTVAATYSCLTDWASPFPPQGHFTENNDLFYFLRDVGDYKMEKSKKVLVQINTRTGKVTPVLANRLPRDVFMTLDAHPPQWVSFYTMKGGSSPCGQGMAQGLTVTLSRSGQRKAAKRDGEMALIPSDEFPWIASLKKRAILETDVNTLQERNTYQLAPGLLPLYFNPRQRKVMGIWRPGTVEDRSAYLATFKGGRQKPDDQLQLSAGDRVISKGGLALVVSYDRNENSIKLFELKHWSGFAKNAQYEFKLPGNMPIREASFDVSITSRTLVAYKRPFADSSPWKQAYIFDYKRGVALGSCEAKKGEALGYAFISGDGTVAICEFISPRSGGTQRLQIHRLNDNRRFDVSFLKTDRRPKRHH